MDTFGFHDKNGRSTFHFLYSSYIDEFEVHHRDLVTALPDELIAASAPEIHKLFQDNNRNLDNNIVEVVQQLGTSILRHELTPIFYYPDSVLRGKEMLQSTFYSIIENYPRFHPEPGIIYTSENYPVEHFILHLKYHRYRLFYPHEFAQEVQPVTLKELRSFIPSSVAAILLDILSDNHVDYYKTKTEPEDIGLFAIKNQEILFFLALKPNQF